METLEIKTKIQRFGNTVYVEYHPANPELEGVCFHGQDLDIQGSVAETVAAYLPIARQAVLDAVTESFGEGSYV
jgi:hypothetical protein